MHPDKAATPPLLRRDQLAACGADSEAQCYCPHGSSLATGQQQGASAKQLYAAWRDRIPHLQAQYGAMRSQPSPGMSAGSTELLVNPRSRSAGGFLGGLVAFARARLVGVLRCVQMPRLYRNPKSMEANNDLPVNAGGRGPRPMHPGYPEWQGAARWHEYHHMTLTKGGGGGAGGLSCRGPSQER